MRELPAKLTSIFAPKFVPTSIFDKCLRPKSVATSIFHPNAWASSEADKYLYQTSLRSGTIYIPFSRFTRPVPSGCGGKRRNAMLEFLVAMKSGGKAIVKRREAVQKRPEAVQKRHEAVWKRHE
eukprot:679705-Prymnesium_polylepis.1